MKLARRARNEAQEKLIEYLKGALSDEDFQTAFGYIDELEEKCNKVINLSRKKIG